MQSLIAKTKPQNGQKTIEDGGLLQCSQGESSQDQCVSQLPRAREEMREQAGQDTQDIMQGSGGETSIFYQYQEQSNIF